MRLIAQQLSLSAHLSGVGFDQRPGIALNRAVNRNLSRGDQRARLLAAHALAGEKFIQSHAHAASPSLRRVQRVQILQALVQIFKIAVQFQRLFGLTWAERLKQSGKINLAVAQRPVAVGLSIVIVQMQQADVRLERLPLRRVCLLYTSRCV